jgi:hypothetical protein
MKTLAALILVASMAIAGQACAQAGADLNISPRRVTLGDKDRSATVYIFNQGDQAATYTVDVADRIMRPDGQIVAPDTDKGDPQPLSAIDYVQYTPRRVTLQPKESQLIRVRVTPPAKGSAGEYRSHLVVTALPPEGTGLTAEQAARSTPDQLSIQVVALFSVSIPIIIREGVVDARADVDKVKRLPVSEGAPHGALQMDLVRKGANSVYGDIEVYAGKGAAEHLVTVVRGVAVYPEIDRRTVTAPLSVDVPANEPMRIVYQDDDTRRGATLATVPVPVVAVAAP